MQSRRHQKSHILARMFYVVITAALLVLLSQGCAKMQKREPSQARDLSGASTTPETAGHSINPTTGSTTVSDANDVAPGAGASGASISSVTCKNANDTRVLNIEKKGVGCALFYLKAGKTSTVAASTNGTDHCEKISARIRSKLESAGYGCQ